MSCEQQKAAWEATVVELEKTVSDRDAATATREQAEVAETAAIEAAQNAGEVSTSAYAAWVACLTNPAN